MEEEEARDEDENDEDRSDEGTTTSVEDIDGPNNYTEQDDEVSGGYEDVLVNF